MRTVAFVHGVGLGNEKFLTVRIGNKWQQEMTLGDEVELFDHEAGGQRGTAKVLDIWVGRVDRLPSSLLELEHDPLARTFSGLMVSLAGAYGRMVEPHEFVTALVLAPVREGSPMPEHMVVG